MGRHLLIYDVEWWILGKHAKLIQQYHPSLDLMPVGELGRYLERHSSVDLNQAYDQCVWESQPIVFSSIFVSMPRLRSLIIILVRITKPFVNGTVMN